MARCDGCQRLVPLTDLRTVLVQDETGYARLQFCQRCRVTR